MYHASNALVPNDARSSGGLNIATLVPGGAHGLLLKSCTPSRSVYADRCDSMRDVLNIFKESWACLRSSSHSCAGKSLSVAHSPAMK